MIQFKILWRLFLITNLILPSLAIEMRSADLRQGRNSKLMDFEERQTDSAPTLPLFEGDDLINEGLLKEVMSDLSNHQEDRGGKEHEDKISLQHTWNLDQDYEILSTGNIPKNVHGSPRSGLLNLDQGLDIGSGSAPKRETQGTARQGLLNNFGIEMGDALSSENENLGFQTFPQLSSTKDGNFQAVDVRQAEPIVEDDDDDDKKEDEEDEDDVRCIDKVIQVEETIYDEKVKCYHTFTEKCHESFITDYIPTQEKKCETSFKKNCHITYKPMMFEETIKICNQAINKVCSNTTIGREICKTHYETNCETRYKTHEVEQDEPVCSMVEEKRCKDVSVPIPGTSTFRHQRQIGDAPLLQDAENALGPVEDAGEDHGDDHDADHHKEKLDLLSIGQECEMWPVQKCTLEKKTVKKVHPETSCRKMPREICAPSNCEFKNAPEICHDEDRSLIQNIPSEDCNLQPQENCKMETVLVPRLIQRPNCIKVPKEICVNAKTNPRKIKKPIVKQWCYKPSDLKTPQTRLALSQFFNN